VDGTGLTALVAGSEGDPNRDCTRLTYRGTNNQIYVGDLSGSSLSNVVQITSDAFSKGEPSMN
jgi:hypothetical protein